jgi:hypothetical protein
MATRRIPANQNGGNKIDSAVLSHETHFCFCLWLRFVRRSSLLCDFGQPLIPADLINASPFSYRLLGIGLFHWDGGLEFATKTEYGQPDAVITSQSPVFVVRDYPGAQ